MPLLGTTEKWKVVMLRLMSGQLEFASGGGVLVLRFLHSLISDGWNQPNTSSKLQARSQGTWPTSMCGLFAVKMQLSLRHRPFPPSTTKDSPESSSFEVTQETQSV